MLVGVQNFSGRRLREARLARGFPKKSLGDLVGQSGAAIGRYEDELDKPRMNKVLALADKLGFEPDFFLREPWPEDFSLIFWRSRVSETKSAREMTEQRMRWLCEIFSFLEAGVNFPSLDLPAVDVPHDFRLIMPHSIECAAMAVRSHWKLRDAPIPDMLLALENAGVPVTCLEIVSDKQDGFCFWSKRLNRPFVGINVHDVSCARARYDAAHELGHLILHRHVSAEQANAPASHKILEQQAHHFAGAFLFPKDAFLKVNSISLDYFTALKKKWGISIAAMIYRAFNLGLIDDQERTILFRNMTRRRWRGRLREPFDDPTEMPLERPRMLRRGVETVISEGIFGKSLILSSLALPTREIEEITGIEGDILGGGEVVQLVTPKRAPSLRTPDLESGEILEFKGRPISK